MCCFPSSPPLSLNLRSDGHAVWSICEQLMFCFSCKVTDVAGIDLRPPFLLTGFACCRAPLSQEDLVDDTELKAKIDTWVQQHRQK